MHTLNLRSFLWFATGVALTITSIATFGAWRADAAVTAGESTFVPVAPCRLFNTLPGKGIPGSNTTPIGDKETRVQPVTGVVGNCNIPTGVSGVAMNVTTLNGTGNSFLALFPADETDRPTVSNLNWTPGQSATPNKVDVKLSPDGKVKIYNNVGTVDVIGDIVGYYTSSTITDLESRLTAAEAALASNNLTITSLDSRLTAAETRVTSLLEDTNVIPSGVTVTGHSRYDSDSINDDGDVDVVIQLPGRAASPLTFDVVNFAPNENVRDADDTCTGSVAAPTAPAGKVCIYLNFTNRFDGFHGESFGVVADRGFIIRARTNDPTPPLDALFDFTWAYTAP